MGLGYRVPLVVASPWSRGGYVCSQVFDHTSILQMLEKFVSHKTGKTVRETNITPWRRAICGDLNSVFRPAAAETKESLKRMDGDAFFRSIHQAQFKPPPTIPRRLTPSEIKAARQSLRGLAAMPQQESGMRPSCPLPYELAVHGGLAEDRRSFRMSFTAGRAIFGERSAGAPFHVYTPAPYRNSSAEEAAPGRTWAFAAAAGQRVDYQWPLAAFAGGAYHLRAHGPNGFYREFKGTQEDPAIDIVLEAERSGDKWTGNLVLVLTSRAGKAPLAVTVEDASYGAVPMKLTVEAGPNAAVRKPVPLQKSHGWYDLRVTIAGAPGFAQRFAGHVETGEESRTDPLMAGTAG